VFFAKDTLTESRCAPRGATGRTKSASGSAAGAGGWMTKCCRADIIHINALAATDDANLLSVQNVILQESRQGLGVVGRGGDVLSATTGCRRPKIG
jgi:hypothetical protein